MNTLTINKLNQLNQRFYQAVSTDFDQTRQQPWAGWQLLLPFLAKYLTKDLSKSQPLRVIDLGCGNGRFGVFLSQNQPISYVGMDSNSPLLAKAADHLKKMGVDFTVIKADFVTNLSNNTFSQELAVILANFLSSESSKFGLSAPRLVALFGVLHHIPSWELRQRCLTNISGQLGPGDLVVLSCWQFDASPNLWQRRIAFNEMNPKTGIDPSELEENDFILDWQRGQQAFRYCHLTTDAELRQLAESAQLKVIESWVADGKRGTLNNYYLLKKRG